MPAYGTVYGCLLNYRSALAALGDAVNAPPYQAPPKAPILYIKPPNTLNAPGAPIMLPRGVEAVEIGPALGLVIGRTACRLAEADALDHLAGYTVINDVTLPHASVYRPAIAQRCRDGFCPIGPVLPATADPAALTVRALINGDVRLEASTSGLIRPAARLLAEVTAFMTLEPGDVVHVGVPHGAPLARAGDRVAVEIAGLGRVENHIVEDEA
ncbi:MAG: fumarylacetoacetate hydrolase family protein [Alphaproteobacteria bacterium]|jgi:5-oxopent-3-ene-1,2,5-tricarboxylate decarboxylase/2-hydroxyhepta-2,4-diene-1,7-dioate isomerase|nr:fumarylacetoacetate hydrolase family protein [Alphaproteobacteria bacterium]